MALGRPRTPRSKSRSPVPPSPSPSNPKSPRPFLPPSHYAAAAGVPYSRQDTWNVVQESQESSLAHVNSPSSPYTIASTSSSQVETHPSDSSFESKPMDERSKSGNASRRAMLSRRRSQLGNLPQLEAQLLPSLRDTIERMTRPPTRTPSMADSHNASFSSRLDISRAGKDEWARMRLPSFPSLSSKATASSISSPSEDLNALILQPHVSASASGPPRTEQTLSHYRSVPSTPTSDLPASVSPNPAVQPKPQSLPRSTLRPPTRKILHKLSHERSIKGVDDSGQKKWIGQSPPRSKTLGGEAGSNPGKTENIQKRDTFGFVSARMGRPRARTDPSDSSIIPRLLRTPIPSTVDHLSSTARSYIPRPSHSLLGQRAGKNHPNPSSGVTRKITLVANTFLPSSSDEESTDDGENESNEDVEDTTRSELHGSKIASVRSKWLKPRFMNPSDLTKKDLDLRAGLGLDFAGRTPSERLPRKFYGDGDTSEEQDIRDSVNINEHRRKALLGIVHGLELGLGLGPEEKQADEESDYCGNEGLAISGSGDGLTTAMQEHSGGQPDQDANQDGRGGGSNSHDHAFSPAVEDNQGYGIGKSLPGSSIRDDHHGEREPARGDAMTPLCPGLQDFVGYDSLSDSIHHSHSDATSVIENSYAIAARERTALGIAPSVSDYFTGGPERIQDGPSLSHTDSDLSSAGSLFSVDDKFDGAGLSRGAQDLFHSLTSKEDVSVVEALREYQVQQDVYGHRSRFEAAQNPRVTSVHEDEEIDHPRLQVPHTPGISRNVGNHQAGHTSWRARFSDSEYHALAAKYGIMEMKRQEIIFQLHLSENAFVHRLQSTVKRFMQPLRMKDQHSWIVGVPDTVSRLFDWLEDILNLHGQIAAALQRMLLECRPIIWDVASQLRGIVPRLEVYQPYLVKSEEVVHLIESLVKDKGSDFGEFVRLQQNRSPSGIESLDSLLMEPVNRLAMYPAFFQELLSLTPKTHTDHVSTISLLYSIEMMVRVMVEVKNREKEYQEIKDMVDRIHGLPLSTKLARRNRRLLLQGNVHRINVNAFSTATPQMIQNDFSLQIPFGSAEGSNTTKRNSTLIEVINGWDSRRKRSGSISSSQLSFRSHESTPSICSSEFPLSPASEGFLLRQPPVLMFEDSDTEVQKPVPAHSCTVLRPGERRVPRNSAASSELLYAIVFKDIFILTVPRTDSHLSVDGWDLVADIGTSRILHVSASSSEGLPLITLDLLPFDLETSHITSIDLVNAPVINVCLSPSQDGHSDNDQPSPRRPTLQDWTQTFEECARYTLRSLSFLSCTFPGLSVDRDADMHDSLAPILASGLPLPKSPSMQSEELVMGQTRDLKQQEREERGWWSLRFQQVLREMQRQDLDR